MKFYFCLLCLALGMTMFVSSCKDDDDDIYSKEDPEVADTLTQEDRYRIVYEAIVNLNCDSLINGADTMFVLNCGQPSPDGREDTRYVFAKDTKHAFDIFSSHFSPAFSEGIKVDFNENEVSVSLGDYGYIKFMLNSTDPTATGMAEIKLKRMPYTMYIQYVPESEFGADYMGAYSPYHPGYVLNINGELWLCTTAWNGGEHPGTLLRFIERDENNLERVNDDYIDVYYQKKPASKDAFTGLQNILHDSDREELYNFVKNIKNLKDAQYLSDVMRIAAFEPYDEDKQIEEFKKLIPDDLFETIERNYRNNYSAQFLMSFYRYCQMMATFCFANGFFSEDKYPFHAKERLIFLTNCSVSSEYSRWLFYDAHDITMQYVIISYNSFVFNSYKGEHEFDCEDFGAYYFKDYAPYMSQMKTFKGEEIKGAEIVWPTMAQ